MWCKNCGSEIEPGAKFCTACGAKVDDNPETPMNEEQDLNNQASVNQAPVKKSKNSKIIFGIIAGILILTLVGFGFYKFMNPKLSADGAEELIEDFFERYFNSETRLEASDYLSATADLNSFISAENLKKSEEIFDKEDGKIKFDLEEVGDSFDTEDDWAKMDFNLKTSVSGSEFSDKLSVEYLKDGRKWKIDKISGLDQWVANKPSVDKLLQLADDFLNEYMFSWDIGEMETLAQSRKSQGGLIDNTEFHELGIFQNTADDDFSLNIKLDAKPSDLKVEGDKINLKTNIKSFACGKEYEDELNFVFVREGEDYKVYDVKGLNVWVNGKLTIGNAYRIIDFFDLLTRHYVYDEDIDYDDYLVKDGPFKKFITSEQMVKRFEEEAMLTNMFSLDIPNVEIDYLDDGTANIYEPLDYSAFYGGFSKFVTLNLKLEDGKVKLNDILEKEKFFNMAPTAALIKNIVETGFSKLYVDYDPAGFDYFSPSTRSYMPSIEGIKESVEEEGKVVKVEAEVGYFELDYDSPKLTAVVTMKLYYEDGRVDEENGNMVFDEDEENWTWLIRDFIQ
uniref:zinc-ribbon domain-containing protein n=1 Tax=Ezakiella massiliensis TaxID=1852374 RepID=UPI00094F022D|nr:zinc ribbon domain-containing protein [Ezakiella massiliensis]